MNAQLLARLTTDALPKSRSDLQKLVLDLQKAFNKQRGKNQKLKERLKHQKEYDTLSGLPKRSLFQDRLEQSLIMAKRRRECVVLMLINLDRFKMVNDTLGYEAGNTLLSLVAQRIIDCVRSPDIVSRLEGDEFSLILQGLTHPTYVELVARKILEQLGKTFFLPEGETRVSGSIGIAVFPDDANDWQGLYKNTDTALQRAKSVGRSTYRFFTPEVDALAQERSMLEMDLRNALEHQEFQIHYQPLLDIKTNQVVGAEALLRWYHPTRGLIPPTVFIPLAEGSGIIREIGKWVLRTACLQMAHWNDNPDFSIHIAVNFSIYQCHECVLTIAEALEESGLKAGRLALEITESIFLRDAKSVIETLQAIRKTGVRLFLDDFGTGYSSLSYLQQLPLNVVKIDRSFVKEMTQDSNAQAITDAIIAMAHSLKLQVIAEGVETQEQLDILKDRGCDMAQGFLFSKPLPVDTFKSFVDNYNKKKDRV